MTGSSYWYSQHLGVERTSRLDVRFNDPSFGAANERVRRAPVPFSALGSVTHTENESRNPQEDAPDDVFRYVDIGSLDVERGTVQARAMYGRDATSSRMRRVMRAGFVLVSTTRPTRRAVAVVPDELNGEICSTGFAVLRCSEDVLPEFLAEFLRTDVARSQFERYCSGSGYPAINQDIDLPRLLVPTPPLGDQRRVLALTASLYREADSPDHRAAAIRIDLPGTFLHEIGVDLPAQRASFHRDGAEGHTLTFTVGADALGGRLSYLHHHPAHAALLDAVRAASATVLLAEIVREPVRRGVQPAYDDDGDRLVLKTVDVRDGWIDTDGALRVSDDFFSANPDAHVRRGDVLVTATGFGSMGKVAVYDHDEPALVDGHVAIVRVEDSYDSHFLAHYLRSAGGAVQFDRWFSGSSGQIELPSSDLERFVVPSPGRGGVTLAEQRRIAEQVGEQEREARRLETAAQERREAARQRFEALVLGDGT